MILVTRLNNSYFYLNAELILSVEATPDTVITLNNYEKLVVREPAKVIVNRIIEYKRQVFSNMAMYKTKELEEWT